MACPKARLRTGRQRRPLYSGCQTHAVADTQSTDRAELAAGGVDKLPLGQLGQLGRLGRLGRLGLAVRLWEASEELRVAVLPYLPFGLEGHWPACHVVSQPRHPHG